MERFLDEGELQNNSASSATPTTHQNNQSTTRQSTQSTTRQSNQTNHSSDDEYSPTTAVVSRKSGKVQSSNSGTEVARNRERWRERQKPDAAVHALLYGVLPPGYRQNTGSTQGLRRAAVESGLSHSDASRFLMSSDADSKDSTRRSFGDSVGSKDRTSLDSVGSKDSARTSLDSVGSKDGAKTSFGTVGSAKDSARTSFGTVGSNNGKIIVDHRSGHLNSSKGNVNEKSVSGAEEVIADFNDKNTNENLDQGTKALFNLELGTKNFYSSKKTNDISNYSNINITGEKSFNDSLVNNNAKKISSSSTSTPVKRNNTSNLYGEPRSKTPCLEMPQSKASLFKDKIKSPSNAFNRSAGRLEIIAQTLSREKSARSSPNKILSSGPIISRVSNPAGDCDVLQS